MKYIDKLRNSGLRPTKQRLQICEVLFNTERTFHFTINELEQKIKDKINFPVILKTCRFGYDGKGQYKVKNFSDLKNKWKKLDYQSCVIEKVIKFDRELSVICSRNIKNNICFYPPFENIHKNHILFETISPSQIDEKINKQLIIISKKILNKLNYIGLLTIEFFLDDENKELYGGE